MKVRPCVMLRYLCLHAPGLLFHILVLCNNKQLIHPASTDFETSISAVEGV